MATDLPARMRALVVTSFETGWTGMQVQELPVPEPGPGQVLVRVAASPVNPSDVAYSFGGYRPRFHYAPPFVPGFEGCGTVVATGPGVPAELRGRRVAWASHRAGAWAEYALVDAGLCVPLPDGVEDDQGATLVINPATALGLLSRAREAGVPAVIQTAAASQVGRMIVRLGRRYGIEVINLVRRPEQVGLLESLGARHVLCTAEAGWEGRLAELAHRLGARVAFDAVGGHLTGLVLDAMPMDSRVIVYGALAFDVCRVSPATLLFQRKAVEGFFVSDWMEEAARAGRDWRREVLELVGSDLATAVARRAPLEEAVAAIGEYLQAMSRGKLLLVPHGVPA